MNRCNRDVKQAEAEEILQIYNLRFFSIIRFNKQQTCQEYLIYNPMLHGFVILILITAESDCVKFMLMVPKQAMVIIRMSLESLPAVTTKPKAKTGQKHQTSAVASHYLKGQ